MFSVADELPGIQNGAADQPVLDGVAQLHSKQSIPESALKGQMAQETQDEDSEESDDDDEDEDDEDGDDNGDDDEDDEEVASALMGDAVAGSSSSASSSSSHSGDALPAGPMVPATIAGGGIFVPLMPYKKQAKTRWTAEEVSDFTFGGPHLSRLQGASLSTAHHPSLTILYPSTPRMKYSRGP